MRYQRHITEKSNIFIAPSLSAIVCKYHPFIICFYDIITTVQLVGQEPGAPDLSWCQVLGRKAHLQIFRRLLQPQPLCHSSWLLSERQFKLRAQYSNACEQVKCNFFLFVGMIDPAWQAVRATRL